MDPYGHLPQTVYKDVMEKEDGMFLRLAICLLGCTVTNTV